MVNAQEWLDKWYPREGCLRKDDDDNFNKKRSEITWLNITKQNLEGSLDLSDFSSLWELDCSRNQLTNLNVCNCLQLGEIHCSSNNLSNLDFLTNLTYPKKLEELSISNNNFISDLTWLTPLVNLKYLDLRNNNFTGSLEPLQNLTELWSLDIRDTDLGSEVGCKTQNLTSCVEYLPESLGMIEYYSESYSKVDYKVLEMKEHLDSKYWKDIHKNFIGYNGEILKREWIGFFGFNKKQTKQYFEELNKDIELIRPEDAKFLHWYLNNKKLDLEWVLKNEEEFKELRDSYSYFGTCKECQQTNTSYDWCHSCNSKHFGVEFDQWTSGNEKIDQFILDCQLEATSTWNMLEWIPYEQFKNIEYIAQGGFGKIEKAEWGEGTIKKWNNKEKKWWRNKYYDGHDSEIIALKTLTNSQDLDKDFLPELMLYKRFKSSVTSMVPCYGISRDLEGNYIMIMKFMKEGNLKEYLKKNYKELKLYDDRNSKLHFLQWIVTGLKDIHRKKLVHRDFHSGNIVVDETERKTIQCKITDLGLCKPANETNKDSVYGVLTYVAPEVLQNKPYTMASDVYSLGMIMYEVITGLPPFYGEEHDTNLALKICQGVRPSFSNPKTTEQIKYPQLLVDLIKKCWDSELSNRPTSREMSSIVGGWFDEDGYYLRKDTVLYQQVQKAEEYNQALPKEIRFPKYEIHKGAVYHSRSINTKQIVELLENSKQNNISQSINFSITELQKALETMKTNSSNEFSQPIEFNTAELNKVNREEITEESTDWNNIHPNFTNQTLIQNWQSNNFTYEQTKDWLSIGLEPTEIDLVVWLRDTKHLTAEETLNHYNLEQLKQEFFNYQLQTKIEVLPK